MLLLIMGENFSIVKMLLKIANGTKASQFDDC
jgi:hypothetical protein